MKRELALLENGVEVNRVTINVNTFMVLNDNSTFTALWGCSIWQCLAKESELETEDLEQIFKGNDQHPLVQKMLEI